MTDQLKSLSQLNKEARELGLGVRKWAKEAGLPWQSLYRKIRKPKTLLLHEYEKLVAVLDNHRDGTPHGRA